MPAWFRASLLVLLLIPSCAKIPGLGGGKTKADKEEKPFGPTGIPQQLRAGSSGGTPVIAGGNVALESLATPSNDIAWTDPDNPDAGIPELAPLMSAPKRGLWEDDEAVARQRAAREGKPLLVWFTDSQRSPACKILSAELFAKRDFEQWAKDKFVRLRVDGYARTSDPNLSMDQAADKEARNRDYSAEMKKRYKVLGYPALLVLSTNGDVIGRYKGYKSGQADYTWGLLRQGESLASKSINEYRNGLIQKGYREWQDRNGNKVFAKLTSYHQGTVQLIEPDGRRSKTVEGRLSDTDRDWIKQQKAMRGIQ